MSENVKTEDQTISAPENLEPEEDSDLPTRLGDTKSNVSKKREEPTGEDLQDVAPKVLKFSDSVETSGDVPSLNKIKETKEQRKSSINTSEALDDIGPGTVKNSSKIDANKSLEVDANRSSEVNVNRSSEVDTKKVIKNEDEESSQNFQSETSVAHCSSEAEGTETQCNEFTDESFHLVENSHGYDVAQDEYISTSETFKAESETEENVSVKFDLSSELQVELRNTESTDQIDTNTNCVNVDSKLAPECEREINYNSISIAEQLDNSHELSNKEVVVSRIQSSECNLGVNMSEKSAKENHNIVSNVSNNPETTMEVNIKSSKNEISSENYIASCNNISESEHLTSENCDSISDSNCLNSNESANSIKSNIDHTHINVSKSLQQSSDHSSFQKAVKDTLSKAMESDNHRVQKDLALAFHSDDDDDDILSELNQELLSSSSPHKKIVTKTSDRVQKNENLSHVHNGLQLTDGLKKEVFSLKNHNRQLLEQLIIRDDEIRRLTQEKEVQQEQLAELKKKTGNAQNIQSVQNRDDFYLPQIKELEKTIAGLQTDLKSTKEKLMSHDTAAKRAVTTLQNELKSRVDQVSKMYEDCLREKDMMVLKFAEAEAKTMEAKKQAEKQEAKMKEAMRDRETMASSLKSAKADKQRIVTSFEQKCTEVSNLHKEMENLKEALQSMDYRMKWFQNKLKDELESHKETKSNLEKMTGKLKQAKEETEVIRMECQAIVKTYQESEEIKSNSLDKELKIKESELKLQMQEKNDTEEIHQKTKKELDTLKSQHKEAISEVKTFKDKVTCLEEELKQNHEMIENYQSIMQRQKGENSELRTKIMSMSNLEEDFTRAQEMIKTLDKDITEFKVSNKDLQKDMDGCRERESKMLSLQSELSRTNALLRSENTNLSNKVSTMTGETEQLRMEVQELDTSVRDLSDKLEEQKQQRNEEKEKFTTEIQEKSKESNDFKQKWEDEMDNAKTLKRRHANNIKDLTRQLQQVKKRLEAAESRDSGSMGSRTNSNGSLNSMENSQTPASQTTAPQQQEFPVITEQVEVDKQVLIERIVKLQKSHARKNEKLEFLGEHIQQLLEEIKKKSKIIQSYILREESGTLSSEDMDAHKTLLARKGGIMASMYSVHQQDGHMTLDLSLQINKKLQAVLEDTLLKNITLKDNLDTLGKEIARLSQQNRKLQLHLQDLEKK